MTDHSKNIYPQQPRNIGLKALGQPSYYEQRLSWIECSTILKNVKKRNVSLLDDCSCSSIALSFSSRECDKKATKGHDIYSRFVELSSDMETIGRELYLKMFS